MVPRWLLATLLLTACDPVTNPGVDARIDSGGPDASGLIDAPAIDAPNAVNDLGVLCSLDTGCASGHQCVVLGISGSQTNGYCSPSCTESGGECAVGYTGPSGGQLGCAVTGSSGQPEFCAVFCNNSSDCPAGLACVAVPDQMLFVCDAQP